MELSHTPRLRSRPSPSEAGTTGGARQAATRGRAQRGAGYHAQAVANRPTHPGPTCTQRRGRNLHATEWRTVHTRTQQKAGVHLLPEERGTAGSHTRTQQHLVATSPQVHGTGCVVGSHALTERTSRDAGRARWAPAPRLSPIDKITDPHAHTHTHTHTPSSHSPTSPSCRASSGLPRLTLATPEAPLAAQAKAPMPRQPPTSIYIPATKKELTHTPRLSSPLPLPEQAQLGLRRPKQVHFCTALFLKKTPRNDVGYFSELPCSFGPDFS